MQQVFVPELGQQVFHAKHGRGTVTDVLDDGRRVVSFDDGQTHRYLAHSWHKLQPAAAEGRRKSESRVEVKAGEAVCLSEGGGDAAGLAALIGRCAQGEGMARRVVVALDHEAEARAADHLLLGGCLPVRPWTSRED